METASERRRRGFIGKRRIQSTTKNEIHNATKGRRRGDRRGANNHQGGRPTDTINGWSKPPREKTSSLESYNGTRNNVNQKRKAKRGKTTDGS